MDRPDTPPAGSGYEAIALIVAAGSGTRARDHEQRGLAKQYATLGGKPMLAHTLSAFVEHAEIDAVMTVIAEGDEMQFEAVANLFTAGARAKLLPPALGGATRQSSVANGLRALVAENPKIVLIHDAARPFVSAGTIASVIEALAAEDGALPVLPLVDTIKRVVDGRVVATEDRESLAGAQTPQGFRFAAIHQAHEKAASEHPAPFTDDAAIAEWAGLPVVAVAGDPANVKITTAEDLISAQARLAGTAGLITRVGQGFDVHAFAPGDSVRLCGIDVPHSHSLKGHSDADVGLHALTDALYGALGDGDIGSHFPPSDQQWAGVDSATFLDHARNAVTLRGGRIIHVDVTFICEHPKIGAHRTRMIERISALLRLEPDQVSVKATTSEGLGFTGRGEGIAAQAVATLALPPPGIQGGRHSGNMTDE